MAALSKMDKLVLISFKSIFNYWKSLDLLDEYNPLEKIVKFESEIEQLPEIEKNYRKVRQHVKPCKT